MQTRRSVRLLKSTDADAEAPSQIQKIVKPPPMYNPEALPFGVSSGRVYKLNDADGQCASTFYLVGGGEGAPTEMASLCQAAVAFDDWRTDAELASRDWLRGNPAMCPRIAEATAKFSTTLIAPSTKLLAQSLGVPVCTTHLVQDNEHHDSTQLQLAQIAYPNRDGDYGDKQCWLLHVDTRWHLLLPHETSMDHAISSFAAAAGANSVVLSAGAHRIELGINAQVRKHCLALLCLELGRIEKDKDTAREQRLAHLESCETEYADLASALGAQVGWLRACASAQRRQTISVVVRRRRRNRRR